MDDLMDQFDDLELQDCSHHDSSRQAAAESSESDDDDDDPTVNAIKAPPSPCKSCHSSGGEAGDLTCAICLGDIPLENMAMVKGCDHLYCAHCILQWALHKESPWCPQCKQPFSYLLTYRTLDGELSDFPVEESVVLLKRARWFVDSFRTCEQASSLLQDSLLADDTAWQEDVDEYDLLAEDEELEAFYYSSAAGRARILLGNRRFGEGGYLASGRRQARPTPTPPPSQSTSRKGKGAKSGSSSSNSSTSMSSKRNGGGGKKNLLQQQRNGGGGDTVAGPSASSSSTTAAVGSTSRSSFNAVSAAVKTPNANGGRHLCSHSPSFSSSSLSPFATHVGMSPSHQQHLHLSSGSGTDSPSMAVMMMGNSPSAGSYVYGSSPSGSGRRAKRNARRAAADAAAGATGEEGSGSGPSSLPKRATTTTTTMTTTTIAVATT